MGINPILKEMTSIEREIAEVWKEVNPHSAYIEGFAEYAGKILVPSETRISRLKQKIKRLERRTQNEMHRKFLNSIYMNLDFFEPYRVPDQATDTFFAHLVKEGIDVAHMRSLAQHTYEALQEARSWLKKKNWPIEVGILTKQKIDSLIGILNTIKNDTESNVLKQELERVVKEAEAYSKAFSMKETMGIKEGDFEEVFPILEKHGGKIGHEHIYPRILKHEYDYPESPEEIEKKALRWMKAWKPKLLRNTKKLAAKYGVPPDIDRVGKELTKRRNVPKSQMVKFVKDLRKVAQKVFNKHLVRMTPKYDTRVIETPPYLINFIPTAAMMALNSATDKPFSVFFVSTDEKRSPASSVPDLMQALLHEEYGHAVNFSNSSTAFGARPSPLSILDTHLANPITDGISFHRELEFVNLLKKLIRLEKLDPNEEKLLKLLQGDADKETMFLENEHIMLQWRMLRFLRAIFDSRVNMGKQSVVDFVRWGSKQTGLDEKKIYNQTFFFLSMVGYAPCYSMAGEAIRELQDLAIKNGKSVKDFNTFASSLGFPGRTLFERELHRFATSK